MKNPFKKGKLNPTAPRSLEDINKEYRDLLVQAATAQYLIYVKGVEVDNVNKRLMEINQEAAKRQELDKQVEAAKKGTNEKS